MGEKFDEIEPSENNICINNCVLSKNDFDTNYYKICSFYFYFDEINKKYICTEKLECPFNYNKLIHGKNECVKSCQSTKENHFEYNNNCLKNFPENFVPL